MSSISALGQTAFSDMPICPVGTNGAPNLKDSGILSGSLCRGACGSDCPEDRCDKIADITLPVTNAAGQQYNCVYKNVVNCVTHQGCRDHDACYDKCAGEGMNNLFDSCHRKCNDECFQKWGDVQCGAWSDALGYRADYWANPDYDGVMLFSDKPELLGPVAKPPLTNNYTGEAISERSGKTWPFKLTLIGPDMNSSISGQIEWPSLDSIHQIVGSKTKTGITFTETADIKKGGAVLNCRYYLNLEGNYFMGTWDSCNDGDFGTISMKTQ